MVKDIESILDKVKSSRGIDFSGYRPNTLKRRISFRLAKLGLHDYSAYLQFLEQNPSECDQLIDTIAINVSSFFRDPVVCEIIAQTVLPEIIEQKRVDGEKQLRVWSAGCAGGEETYSLAILIFEALQKDPDQWTVHLFGTDIDQESLLRAATARYPRESLRNTKLGCLDSYFTPQGDGYVVNPEIRGMVNFSADDLTSKTTFAPKESVFGEFDLVFCRNVLIYFNAELQSQVTGKFARSLCPGGYLVLGEAEKLDDPTGGNFHVVDRRNRIYKKRTT